MNIFKNTENHKKFWRERKIDWKVDYQSPEMVNHPHRKIITGILKTFGWLSLIEIGCGGGANLINIVKNIGGKQVGGVDVNPEAIALCQSSFQGGLFKVNSGDDIMLSDKSTDVVLSDMCLIYVDPSKIKKYLEEIKRIGRHYVLLCEFHSTSWWDRMALKINSGYNAYNYRKLLAETGFYDVLEYKLKKEDWPGGEPQKTFGYIFLAKVPKR